MIPASPPRRSRSCKSSQAICSFVRQVEQFALHLLLFNFRRLTPIQQSNTEVLRHCKSREATGARYTQQEADDPCRLRQQRRQSAPMKPAAWMTCRMTCSSRFSLTSMTTVTGELPCTATPLCAAVMSNYKFAMSVCGKGNTL